jgi:hypothetical protein
MKRKWPDDDQTTFINVDLDIVSRSPLEPLVKAFGQRVFVLHVGGTGRRHEANVELQESHSRNLDADTIIRGLVGLVTRLSPAARRRWNGAESREFNIGVQGGLKPRSYEFKLRAATLRAVARVRGDVMITTYAVELGEGGPGARAAMSAPPDNELQQTKPAQATERRR